MNYVCTFGNSKVIDNIINYWLKSLKNNFSGKAHIIVSQDVTKAKIEEIKKLGASVTTVSLVTKERNEIIKERLRFQKEFIESLNDNDKIFLLDGSDIIFQNDIDYLFDYEDDKIHYGCHAGKNEDSCMKRWNIVMFHKDEKKANKIFEAIEKQPIAGNGHLLGTKEAFKNFFLHHFAFLGYYKVNPIFGSNQLIFNYSIAKYPECYKDTNENWIRAFNKNYVTIKNGKYYNKDGTLMSFIHFYGGHKEKMKNYEI